MISGSVGFGFVNHNEGFSPFEVSDRISFLNVLFQSIHIRFEIEDPKTVRNVRATSNDLNCSRALTLFVWPKQRHLKHRSLRALDFSKANEILFKIHFDFS